MILAKILKKDEFELKFSDDPKKDAEKNLDRKAELEKLIKQILKIEHKNGKEKSVDKDFEDFEEFSEPESPDEKINRLTEETFNLFVQDNFYIQPESYKLNINYGDNAFKGYYERAMSELKKMKVDSYTMFSRKIESENLQTALVIIRDKKQNNVDTFLFDSKKKAQIDAYKWSNIVWWHILYDLEENTIF